jgi:hypothetical protein
MKIRPVGTELFHADGQTDMTELIITFRNFANAPKIIVTDRRTRSPRVIDTIPQGKTFINTATTTTFGHSSRSVSAFACQAAATPKPVAAFLR